VDALRLEAVLAATGGRRAGADGDPELGGVSIDSRAVTKGQLFVCLPGDRFDGHDFAEAAAASGVGALVVERELPVDLPQVVVSSALQALGALGQLRRRAATDALVVGVTGTNGKTGTKDLATAALGAGRRTVGSLNSYNNAVGVPLTLLDIASDTEAVVVELGTNAPGEIASLTALAEPELAIITNVHAGHLEGLGSLAGVRAEKACLLQGLVGRQVSVLNRDDPSYSALADLAPGEVVSYGLSAEADVRARDVRCSIEATRFVLEDGDREVTLRHLGRHAVFNGLAALACAQVAGVDLDAAVEAMGHVPPPPGRLQFRRRGGLFVLDDSYNANPGSLAAAAAAVAELGHPGRRVFVVGDMLELGEASHELHRAAGRALAQSFPHHLVSVGRFAKDVVAGAVEIGLDRAQCQSCADVDEAREALRPLLQSGDLVLVKASRRMALEEVVAGIALPEPEGEAAIAS
jgi:UDP-N-acetylmuramoyl-tripeptide--D-alanyl-D-alanine ligase